MPLDPPRLFGNYNITCCPCDSFGRTGFKMLPTALHDCSGNQENFNTTEYFSNLLRQGTASNIATLKSDTEI